MSIDTSVGRVEGVRVSIDTSVQVSGQGSGRPRPSRRKKGDLAYCGHTYNLVPYFDPTHTRTGWIGQPPILDRLEVVTDNGDVDTLGQATP